MRTLIALALALPVFAANHAVIVAGLGGEADYEQRFQSIAQESGKLFQSGNPGATVTVLTGDAAVKSRLLQAIAAPAAQCGPNDSYVLMLIGHGTFDGADYKFNLKGPDVTARELAEALDRVPCRQLVVNSTSASGGGLAALQKENRIVIAATRSGTEKNATVFVRYWVEAMRDISADADKNESVSALEAYRFADQKTVKFYEQSKRLATEHALLEDSGKGEGVRAPSAENGQGLLAAKFNLVRFGEAQRAAATPAKQKLLARKEELEQKIDELKYRKAAMAIDEYKKSLAALLLELAQTQEELEK